MHIEPGVAGAPRPGLLVSLAKALADPTRLAVLGAVAASDGILVGRLTQRFGLHHSAVRSHLQALRDVGLVTEETTAPTGRGRPALIYRPVHGALERWLGLGPHRELAAMLLDLVTSGDDPGTVGRRASLRLAARFRIDDPLERVLAVSRLLGFDPEADESQAATAVTLRTCPYADDVAVSADVVCGLHRGVIEGVAAQGSLEVLDLERADPARGGCVVRFGAA